MQLHAPGIDRGCESAHDDLNATARAETTQEVQDPDRSVRRLARSIAPVSRRHPHAGKATDPALLILKSIRYGSPSASQKLPYRIDQLRDHGYGLSWTDRNLDGWAQRVAAATEARTTPWVQALLTTRARRRSAGVIAMFESEGHGLALVRRVTRRRQPPLIVIGCWLTDLVRSGGRRARLYRWLYRSVDAVVVFSSNQRAMLVEQLGLEPDRIHVVRFGVDLDELTLVPTSDDGPIVAAGRDLGRDWSTLAGAVDGTGWAVTLITRPSQVVDLELPPEIAFRSTVDRDGYLSALAGAVVVVLPTHVREYPTGQTVLLEAMAMGKACVVTDTPAMRDYVEHEVTGLLVPPGDAEALRTAITRLLGDDDLRRSIGAAARAQSTELGGSAAMWEAVAAVVNGVRGDGRTRPGT